MLRRLSIRNYALIESIDWDCSQGWTVLTGETGSGKSILLGALGLVLGDRAEGAGPFQQEKCIVEAEFAPSPAARALLGEWDDGGDCIIRRSIAPGGRSRAYVNDEPVKLHTLKALAPLLVDLHGQQDGQRLHASEGLLHAIDSHFGKASALAVEWRERYGLWKNARSAWESLNSHDGMPDADADYLRFQLEELEALDFSDPNLRNLDNRLEQLAHAQDVYQALASVSRILSGDGPCVLSQLRTVEQSLEKVVGFNSDAAQLLERVRSCRIELDDVVSESESATDSVDLNPEALAAAEADRNRINRLLDKHRAANLEALAEREEAMRHQLEEAKGRSARLEQLQAEVDLHATELERIGELLQAARQHSAEVLAHSILRHLQHLKLPSAQLAFDWTATELPEPAGPARVSLSFSANPGRPLQPLIKVASGGERSRVMLALKAALTEHLEVPTLILDEIDAGVSGDVAARMGDLIATIAKGAQVITISHLPQVAGKADHHFKVFKEERDGRAHTGMTPLDEAGRIEELAAMLSGENIGEAARAQARSLMA